MEIVICDDCIEDLAEINRLLDRYMEKNTALNIRVVQYADPAALYRRLQQKELGDIYILDMIMEDKSGTDIGGLIRSISERSVIIYITSSDEYALEAYQVRAVRYLLKPVREELFFEALDYAVSDVRRVKGDALFPVKTREGLVTVSCSQIEYIENYSRTLHVWLTGGSCVNSIFIRKSFEEEVRPVTQDRRFVCVHKSFVVNMEHIDRLAQGMIVVESGRQIPVSKTRAADVKKAYLMFVSTRYR